MPSCLDRSFRFFVEHVLAAPRAVLHELKTHLNALVLIGVVIEPVALRALKFNEIFLAGHSIL